MPVTCPWTTVEGLKTFLEGIGSICVLLLWMAPIRDIWTGRESVFAKKSTAGLVTGFPYVASLFNCLLWVMYALDKLDLLLIPTIVNVTGFLLNLSFTGCFWYYSSGTTKGMFKLRVFGSRPAPSVLGLAGGLTRALAETAVMGFITIVGFGLLIAVGSTPVGYLAAFVNALMLFSPLAAAGTIIKSRSTKGMPFLPLLLIFVCSTIWFGFGLNICDLPIMIPNGLGVIFGTAQLSLYYWARRYELSNPDVETSLSEDFDAGHFEVETARPLSGTMYAPVSTLESE
jgi:solute carrier family 50 protein (sugar transporter)